MHEQIYIPVCCQVLTGIGERHYLDRCNACQPLAADSSVLTYSMSEACPPTVESCSIANALDSQVFDVALSDAVELAPDQTGKGAKERL